LNRFWEPVEDLLLGTANVFLQSLAYSLDFADEICIVDYKVSHFSIKKKSGDLLM
jgi:hypothetical protein